MLSRQSNTYAHVRHCTFAGAKVGREATAGLTACVEWAIALSLRNTFKALGNSMLNEEATETAKLCKPLPRGIWRGKLEWDSGCRSWRVSRVGNHPPKGAHCFFVRGNGFWGSNLKQVVIDILIKVIIIIWFICISNLHILYFVQRWCRRSDNT